MAIVLMGLPGKWSDMVTNQPPVSRHFSLEALTGGVYACIHKPGGGAYSNAGILDLGERTLLVDALETIAAGRDLRSAAEALFERPVDTIALTHAHSDHWIGASAFATSTTLLASKTIRQVTLELGEEIIEEYENPAEWQAYLEETQEKLRVETDERMRAGLENTIYRTRLTMSQIDGFHPRYANLTYEGTLTFEGSQRRIELHPMGRGHSDDDAVFLLHREGIAFIGDVGFFNQQPFLGFCDLDLYRKQCHAILDLDFNTLVPGHGPVGDKENLLIQLEYFDVLEELIGAVVLRGGSYEEALRVNLPEPYDAWLYGGMGRFETNVRYLFARAGGEAPEM